MKTNTHKEATVDAMLTTIDNRVAKLNALKEELRTMFGVIESVTALSVVTTKTPKKAKSKRVDTRGNILKVMTNQPMTLQEILAKLKNKRWTNSKSKDLRQILSATLTSMRKQGTVEHTNSGWRLVHYEYEEAATIQQEQE